MPDSSVSRSPQRNRRRSRAPPRSVSRSSETDTPYYRNSLPQQESQVTEMPPPLPAPGQGAPPEQGNEQLRLRLDLNLDVEVTIKAKVHGDVTLALLG